MSILFFSYRKKQKKEISQLKNEKLQSEIRHKKTQLATTTLHLLDKTKFIDSIKTHIHEVLKQEDGTLGHRRLKSIIKDIDSNSSNDDNWKNFEIHFDEVHEYFLTRIRNDYPAITAREIRLCAYLRMNLSTKEIADLLKISVRGVEIARFRLRRKFNLAKEENLVSFIMTY
jgi:DNA-binding CsgD family transcriptional regulator